ncbi:MAG: halocyanin domain-containing protein [Halorientalis sp.]
MEEHTRRAFLGAGVTLAAGIAGCASDGNGGTPTDTPTPTETPGTVPGDQYPTVERWLTTTAVGGADDSYGGTVVDARGRDTVTVDVGSEGNGGHFAFGPSAVLVSAGTTVEWVWTGEGGAHNVEALPEEQLQESDYEFTSGEPVTAAGTEFTRTLEEPGIALYHCEPHLSLGMKGAIAVE